MYTHRRLCMVLRRIGRTNFFFFLFSSSSFSMYTQQNKTTTALTVHCANLCLYTQNAYTPYFLYWNWNENFEKKKKWNEIKKKNEMGMKSVFERQTKVEIKWHCELRNIYVIYMEAPVYDTILNTKDNQKMCSCLLLSL